MLFHRKRHPTQLGGPEIEEFLTHRAVDRRVSASTQIYTHVMRKGANAVQSPLDT
jgi:hypothetical protein